MDLSLMMARARYNRSKLTAALLHFDTGYTDLSGKTWTNTGTPSIDTTNYKWGPGSLALNGSSYLSCSSSDFTFGAGAFTIECWVKGNTNSNKGVFSTSLAGSHVGAIGLAIASSTGIFVQVNDTSFLVTTSVPAGFFHLALTRQTNGGITVFINGVSIYTNVDVRNLTTTNMYIGGYYSSSFLMTGNIDDFRVTKGAALYISNFTPPTGPFTYP